MDQLTQNVSGMSLNPGQDGDWEKASKKNKNRAGSGSGSGRQWGLWGSQVPAPKAWGQPDTNQRLGIRGTSGSGLTPGSLQNPNPHPGRGLGPRGKPQATTHGLNWASGVGLPQPKYDTPEIIAEEEEDDDEDDLEDEDDDLLSDGDSDESPHSHESMKSHRLLKGFFEILDKLTLEEINDTTRQWHCPACQGGPGSIDWFRGLQALAAHARTKGSKRVQLHRIFGKLLEEELNVRGTSVVPAGEAFGNWEGLKKETKDYEIVWPPMVLIMNTRLEKSDDDKWLGMGNQELIDYFSSYTPVRAKHSYGPQGHRGISLLIFESSAVGYMEAERLHKHFLEQGTGKEAWDQRRKLYGYGGKRQLYGCLPTKDDMEMFNQHSKGKQRLKYEMRSYNEMVVSQMKQMSEDNQQLSWFKQKVYKEKRHSKALEDSLSFMTDKLRKASDHNRLVTERSKMHHEQNQQELNYQDNFFKEEMARLQEAVYTKEDKFESFLQGERKKIEDSTSHASSTEDRRLMMEEMNRFKGSQDRKISQFTLERDELQMILEKKVDEVKMKYQKLYHEEMLALEKEFDASLTRLMEKYAPGSTCGEDASSVHAP